MKEKNKGEPELMTYADVLKQLIEENAKLLLENERLKQANKELKKKAARAATRNGKK